MTRHEYVDLEKDSFAAAFDWAVTKVATRYPGQAEILHTLEEMIHQHLNGRGELPETRGR